MFENYGYGWLPPIQHIKNIFIYLKSKQVFNYNLLII